MIIKAELWDKTQYLFRNYYDRMMHAVLYYDNQINNKVIEEVLMDITEKVPILHSSYYNNPIRPFWKVRSYSARDILYFKNSENIEQDIHEFLTRSISPKSNVQYKVALFHYAQKSVICVVVNHMCFDGGDFKYFLSMLAENYNRTIEGFSKKDIKNGSRSHKEIYKNLNLNQQKIAKRLYKNVTLTKELQKSVLTEYCKNDSCRILKKTINKELFIKIKKMAKLKKATINDVMLALYIRALYKVGNISGPITVSYTVDLRRYMKHKDTGLTNHTGFASVRVTECGDKIIDTLYNIQKSQQSNKNDAFLGLYGLPLLNFAYKAFPNFLSEAAIKLGYKNPILGMSNIGVLDKESLNMQNAYLVDGFVTGAIKYKPYIQLAFSTLSDKITMTIAIKGNDKDDKIIRSLFDKIIDEADNFVNI